MNYKEITSEIVLTKNSKSGMWENEEVMFWNDEDYGWRFSNKTNNEYNYGYDSLKEAVMCYLSGENHSKAATNFKYSASMYISEKSEYQQNNKFIGKGITDKRLYCKRTDKFFIK